MDEHQVKKLSSQLEQAIKENTRQRSKYLDEPLRFEDSEIALDQAIQDFRSIASFPELFDKVQIWPDIVGLLGHENTDIVVDIIHMLNDFCEEDVCSLLVLFFLSLVSRIKQS
jgi:beta-catenin-like protein 1